MITLTNVSLNFDGTNLFSDVNLEFSAGNCYGIIGANGVGKSTFLRLLSGNLETSTGDVSIKKGMRMSELKQDQYAFDQFTVIDTIVAGNAELYKIMKDKEALYSKEDFTNEDGILASELEGRFEELNGWEAEADALKLIQGLGLGVDILENPMNSLTGNEKFKVLLAQALFGKPDIILLDEPTNNLDVKSVYWLEDFIMDYNGTIIVVSHDRHFLNTVCTHIVDINYSKVKIYVGNYDFWYESSQLIQRMKKEQNRKSEEKAVELQNFIARFSANKSKARQATSRKKLLEKLTFEDMPTSSRKSPFICFKMDREPGKEILTVENLSKTIDGVKVLNNISFRVNREDKIAFVGDNEIAVTTLFKILMGEMEPDDGFIKWGITTSQSYFPKDNTKYFNDCNLNILNWIQQYSKEKMEVYLRSFLGRMIFSNDDVFKQVNVLSGGEKVRCMLSRMMMKGSNVLVVNQPTNHLDIESIIAFNNGMIDFKGIILFFSHDRQFVQSIANRIIEFVPKGMIDKITTYDEYIEASELESSFKKNK